MAIWNPWHGCHKISSGCKNCYVYRRDESVGRDASVVTKTKDFDLPRKKNRHKHICHEPMLGSIDISHYLESGQIEYVLCGGESGPNARPCYYDWILATREQCIRYGVAFHFKQTGAVFIKDGKTYHIERKFQQEQASKANIDYAGNIMAVNATQKDIPRADIIGTQMEIANIMTLQEPNQMLSKTEALSHEEWHKYCRYTDGMDQPSDGGVNYSKTEIIHEEKI